MSVSLCDRFPALDPFRVRAQRFHDVILLFSRLIDKTERKGKNAVPKGGFIHKRANGQTVIYKPATSDDVW